MSILKNRAGMSTATTGTGTITLGAALTGYQSFADAGVADGDVVSYLIEDGNNWEIGRGTYASAGTTLARTTILESSNSDAAIDLSGDAEVYVTALAEDMTILQTSGIVQVELYRSTLAEAGRFDYSSIPATYDHLLINVSARSSVNAPGDGIHCIFNNDTTVANYRRQLGQFYGAAIQYNTGDDPTAFQLPGMTGLANSPGIGQLLILNYANTTFHKVAQSRSDYRYDANTPVMAHYTIFWESTTAINQITIHPDGYDTDKFIAGSFCQIIGIKTVA